MKDAIASGIDGYDDDVKKSVRKAAHGLRLTRDAAMSIASAAVSIRSDCFLYHHTTKMVSSAFLPHGFS